MGLAWSTIGCYRSAVCTILQPDVERTYASHKSVKRLMKSIFFKRPPKSRVFTPWRVHRLLKLFERMGPIDTLTLKELTWRTVCLVSLATSKRMADMSLKRPPKRKVFSPWRVHKLLNLLERMGSIDTLTLKELIWKIACLVNLATSKRMADMY